jgi:predicted glycoside hydrolase/deacetylase ChbG (UPF0249 family)
MDTLSLIVRGDEFGLCHASNQAIWEGFEAGLLTCASLMITGPWVAEAAALAHDHPEWEIGLHLNLVCDTEGCRWGPIAGATAVPSLVEPNGAFCRNLTAQASAEDISREMEAQVDRALAWGITPAFLECAEAAHPLVSDTLHRLSERRGILTRMTDWGLRPLFNPGESVNAKSALAALAPGAYLWIVCPSQPAPETCALWPEAERIRRHADARAMVDPEVLAVIKKQGIELLSFRQHAESRLGAEAEKE